MTFLNVFFYRNLWILRSFSHPKPGWVSKCQNFLWNRSSSSALVLSVELLDWEIVVNYLNENKSKLVGEKYKGKKKFWEKITYTDFYDEHVLSNSSIDAIVPVTEVVLINKSFPAINLCLLSDTIVSRRHYWYGTSHSSGHFFPQLEWEDGFCLNLWQK